MSEVEASPPEAVEAGLVVDYLRTNPDFFERHPEVLDSLSISHAQEGAVSLIERQIRMLRDQNEQQRARLDALMEIAHQNDGLNHRVHRLLLDLLLCADDNALFAALEERLKQEFQVEQVVCRRLAEEEVAESAFVQGLLEHGAPKCGRFSRENLAPLFGAQADEVRSAVLVPLRDGDVNGVLAIASADEHRYHPGVGTDYLASLGEIVARLMRRNDSAG